MRTRDAALVVLGACLGAGLAWALLDRVRPGPAGDEAADAAREVAALRERVATLERERLARPAPLAASPRAAPAADAPAGGPDAAGSDAAGRDAGAPPARKAARGAPAGADGEAAAPGAPANDPAAVALERLLGGPGATVQFGGGGAWVGGGAPAGPPLDPSDVRRLLDDGTDASLVRAAQELMRSRDRSFLADLVDRVNRPEHRAAAPQVIPTIAALKDRAWTALQATGAPDTPVDGDHGTAWASKGPDMGVVTLELTYDRAVRVDGVRIHETLAPGAVAKVEALGPDRTWVVVWEGTSTVRPSPSFFEPTVTPTAFATDRIRLTLDTNRVAGWNEIDAVELVGDGWRQWASGATASSCYADP